MNSFGVTHRVVVGQPGRGLLSRGRGGQALLFDGDPDGVPEAGPHQLLQLLRLRGGEQAGPPLLGQEAQDGVQAAEERSRGERRRARSSSSPTPDPTPALKAHVQETVRLVQNQNIQTPYGARQVQTLRLPPEHVLQTARRSDHDVPAEKPPIRPSTRLLSAAETADSHTHPRSFSRSTSSAGFEPPTSKICLRNRRTSFWTLPGFGGSLVPDMKLRFGETRNSRELWKPPEKSLHHLTDLQSQLSGGGDDQSPHLQKPDSDVVKQQI